MLIGHAKYDTLISSRHAEQMSAPAEVAGRPDLQSVLKGGGRKEDEEGVGSGWFSPRFFLATWRFILSPPRSYQKYAGEKELIWLPGLLTFYFTCTCSARVLRGAGGGVGGTEDHRAVLKRSMTLAIRWLCVRELGAAMHGVVAK